jgi:hypothetical protein
LLQTGAAIHGQIRHVKVARKIRKFGGSDLSLLQGVENFLPVTVVSAIGLFFLKEVVEFFKKRSERLRKIKAYKILISEELLKNAWTIRQLRELMREIDDEVFERLAFTKAATGEFRVIVHRIYGRPHSTILPVVHTSIFDKAVVEVAAIDSALFEMAKETYGFLAEIRHVRDSILNFAENESIAHFVKGLPLYAKIKLDEAEASSKSLFKLCTGDQMAEPKIRSFA